MEETLLDIEGQEAPEGQEARPRIGRDELNLTEFPFALLTHRAPKGAPAVLEFRDGSKEWTVEGSSKYGLPTAGDVAVYVALMELSREQDFPERVTFSRLQIIERLGWDPHGESYDRLNTALRRLVNVTITARNAFYDAQARQWEREKAFHVLEAYEITDSRRSKPSEASLFPSWVRWSPEIYANLQAGHIKRLDVDLFLSLRSAIAQALYRYLDAKKYDGKPQYRIGLKKLAFEHLGLSRAYYPSDIKRKLRPAHEELITAGFLAATEYAVMRSQPGEEMVVYRFPSQTPNPPALVPGSESIPEAAAPLTLAERLQAAGISRKAAAEFTVTCPEEAERQLEYLPHRQARNPGAVLAKAIREGWAAPVEWTRAEEKRQAAQARSARASKAAAASSHPSAKNGPPAVQEDRHEAFSAWLAALPAPERQALETAAREQLRTENPILASLGEKHPDSPVVQSTLRDVMKRLADRQE